MKTVLTFILLMLMVLTAGCNNPSGGSVVDRGHSPLLDPPGAFQFKAVKVKDGTANLGWTSSQRVETYSLKMGTSTSAINTPVTCGSATAVTCDVSGLAAGTTYYFALTATNAAGTTNAKAVVPALSVTSFDFTSSTVGDGKIDLDWGTSTGATTYTVRYGTSSGSYSNSVANVTSPYSLTGLQNGVRYYVRIVASNASNGYAESDSEINGRPLGPPPAPANLSIGASSTAASLNWDAVSGATSYKVYRGTASGTYAQIATVTSPSYNDTGLTDGTTYYYALKSDNGVFESTSYSTEVPVKLIENFAASTLTAAPAANQLTISWPTVTGADTYTIQYGTSPTALTQTLNNQTSPAVISSLTGGATYYVRVRAINTIGGGTVVTSTNTLSAAPVPAIAAPTGITIAATPGNIRIGWNSVAGATSYQVWRGTVSGTHTSLATGLTGNFYDDTVANGVAYYYVVKSFNGYPSVASSQVSAKAINTFSIGSVTSPTPTSLVVNWATPVDGADNFDLRWRTSSGSYTLVQNVSSGHTISGLTGGTTYYMYLTARNTVGSTTTSLVSAEVNQTTALAPPTTVTVSAVPDDVTIAWSTVPGAASYKIHRATVAGGPYTEIANGLTSSPYLDSGVTNGTTYYYVVTSFNGSDSAYSTERSIRPIADFTIDAVTPLTNTTMKVDWTTVAGAANYDVYYRIGTGSYTTATTNLGSGVSTYTITGLSANTNYNVRVVAKNTVGVTTTVTAPDVAGKTTTAAPTGVSATATTGQIRIAWTNVTGASSYKILRGTVSGTLTEIEGNHASTPYDDTSVVAGTHYYYAVVANNGADSPRSSEVQGKTIDTFTITSAVAVSGTSIQVNWTAPAGADSHDVLYRSTGATTTVAKNPGDSITGLSPGVTYYISVKAKNAIGSGTSYTTPEVTAVTTVGPPSPITISATPGKITLNWSPVSTALSYKVSRGTASGGPYTEVDGNVTSMPWDDNTVADGTRYYYVVKTYNGGDSVNSSEVSAKPVAAFTISSTSATYNTVTVSWNGDAAVAGADSFNLEYKTTAGSTWTAVNGVTSPYTLTGRTANTSYDFRIVGRNTTGTTTTYTTPAVTQLTAPSTIGDLTATSTSASQVALDWGDISGATTYKVFRKSGGSYDYNTPLATVGSSSYLDTTVVANTTYEYVVRSNNGTDSADSNQVQKKPIGTFNLTGVAGVAGSSTSLALIWDAATGADNYKVEYGATSTVYTGTVNPVAGPTYTLTGLTANTQYFIRITAQNSTGSAIASNEMNAFTSTVAPTSVVATATTTTSGRITLTWSNATGATNYNIYRSTTSNTYNYASALATGVASGFVDTSIAEGTTYYYVVRANNGSESPSSSQASAQAIANFTIDTTASNAAGNQATITWTDTAGETSYDLLYGTASATTPVLGVTSPHNLSGLSPGQTYYFRVRAKNSIGGVLTEVLTPEVSQKMAVAAPTGLAFTTSGNSVNLTWNTVAGADSYKVYRSTTSGTYGAPIASGLTSGAYTDSPTIDGSTYYYVVKSFNGTDSVNSTEISVRPIAAFTFATTVLSSTSIRLTWSAVTGATAANYEIHYGTASGTYTVDLTNQSSPRDITGLSTGTTYYFMVTAKNSTTSRNAPEVAASTAFGAPAGLAGVATPTQVDLTWSPVSGATEYRLYRRVGAGAYGQIGGAIVTESYSDTGLTNGTVYDYVVRAYNGTESADSNVVLISPISSFTFSSATATSATQADLVWTDATGETSYDIYYGTSSGNYGAPINQTGVTRTLSGLSPGTTYYAKIIAKNNPGTATTVESSELSFTTAPAAISNLAVTSPIAGRARLTWSAPATATSYTILRGTTSGTHGTTVIAGTTGTSYNDDTVTNGVTYYYVINSTNGTTSANSNEVFIQPVANFGAAPTTTALSSTSIQVDWTAVTGASTYEVWMGTSTGNYGGSAAATVSAPTVTATITGLTSGVTYYFKVVAKNAIGATSSRDSSEVSQITPLAAPPITLSAVQTPGSVSISWTQNGASNYRLSRGTSPATYDTFVNTGNVSSYTDNTVTNGQTYYYTLQSYNGAYSGYATEKSIQPIASFNVTSTSSTANSITVNWTAPQGAATVEVEYRTGAGAYTNAGAQSSGYTIGSLTSGTTYDVRLVAKNTIGGVTTTYTTAAVQQITAIGAPATVALVSTDGTVGISWSTVTGATSYKIFRASSSGGYNYSSPIATIVHPTLSTSDSPTRDGTTYYYVIRTFNGSDSASSTEYSIKPLGAFTLSSATPASATQVNLNWTAAVGADSYDVYYKLTSGSYGAPTNVVGTSTSITGLTANSNYSFYVVAKNSTGATLTSSTLTAQTATAGVTTLAVNSDNVQSQTTLTWTGITGATHYNIYRGPNAGALAYVTQVTHNAGTNTYVNTGLTNGTAYFYSVRAYNGTESVDSNIAQVKPISNFSLTAATAASSSSVNLTWGAVSGEDTFDVYYGPVAQPTLFNIQDFAAADATSGTVSGLSAATQYTFSIRARNLQGSKVTVNSSFGMNATTAAAAPTISISSVTPTTISLSWTNVYTYNVYRATAVGGPYSQVASGVTSIHPDSITADGTTYFYKVRTYNGSESVDSNIVSAQPIPNFTITSAVAYSTTEIDVTWPAVAGASTYDVLYRLNATGGYTTLSNRTSPFRLSSLAANSMYGIVIQAKNSTGAAVATNSTEVQATTKMVAPVLATSTGGKSQVALTWTYSGTGTPTYKVLRGTVSGSLSVLPAGGSVSGLSFTDSTAVAGTTYYYAVQANNGSSDSALSNEHSKQPMGAFTITSVTGGSASVIVNYPAVTGAESYDIQWGTTAALGTTITGANRPHTISSLTVGQTYYVRVVAKNTIGGGSSINSDADSSGTPNSPPVIGAIAAQSTDAGTAIAVPFTLTDSNHVLTCAGSMTGSSSNTTTVPNGNIVFSGTVPNCTATITPAAGQMGNVNITLTANDTVDTAQRTFALNVIPCTVASIVWTTQPANVAAGNTWASAPVVTLKKADGTTCTSNTSPVSLYVTLDNSVQQDADLNWISNSVTPVNGVATFTNAKLTRAGTGYTIAATQGGVNTVDSNTFNVTAGAASKIIWSVQPTTTNRTSNIIPSPTIQTADAYSNIVNSNIGNVTVSLMDNTEGATLSGTLTRSVNGSVAFSGLSLNVVGSYYLRATPANGWAVADSNTFSIIQIVTQNTTSVMELLTGSHIHTGVNTNYPGTGISFGSDYLDGTTTYTWQLVATNNDNQNSTVRIRQGSTNVSSITVPSNTTVPTLFTTTISNASVPTSANWSHRIEKGETVIFSSRVIVNQTGASRTQVYIPLTSMDNNTTATQSASSTSATMEVPTGQEQNFPPFEWDSAKLARVDSLLLMATSRAGACVQLFNRDTNTAIGSEVCNTSGSDSIVSVAIDPSIMPSSALIEARMRSNSGSAAYVTKAGLIVRLVSIEKMLAIQRVAPAATLTATTNFVENRAYSSRGSYGAGTVAEYVKCRAKYNTSGGGSFIFKNHTTNTSGTAGSTTITASTINFSSQSAYTSLEAGPMSSTNGTYEYMNYTHTSGSYSLSHCLQETEVTY